MDYMCNEANIKDYLQVLSQHFNAMDIPNIETDSNFEDISSLQKIFLQLTNSTYALIQQQKKTLRYANDVKLEKNKFSHMVDSLKDKNHQLELNIHNKETDIKKIREQLRRAKYDLEEQLKQNDLFKSQLQTMKKHYNSKEKQMKHSVTKEIQDKVLRNQLTKKAVSGDNRTWLYAPPPKESSENNCASLSNFECLRRLEQFTDVICKLQDENASLVSENLNLKEDLLVTTTAKMNLETSHET